MKCYAHFHMTATQYAVWDVCRSLSHENGILYFNAPGIADRFESMGKNYPYQIAEELECKGFFKLLKPSARRKDGTFTPRQYRVLSHDEWAAEHPGACDECRKKSPLPKNRVDQSTTPDFRNDHSRISEEPSRTCGNNLIQRTDTTPTSTESDNQKPLCFSGVDGLIERFSNKRKRTARPAQPKLDSAPLPESGEAVRDTQHEAEQLSAATANVLTLRHPDAKAAWTASIKSILDAGHSSEKVRDVLHFTHRELGPSALVNGGPRGFAQNFAVFEGTMRSKQGDRN